MKDAYSLKILEALQQDSRMTVQQISERVGLSTTPCWKRIKDMEAQGVITGYTVQVDRKKVGLNLMVMVEVNLAQHTEKSISEFEATVEAAPQVLSCYATTGASDYVLMVMTSEMAEYEMFLKRVLLSLPAVAHVRSIVVLREVKQMAGLPI